MTNPKAEQLINLLQGEILLISKLIDHLSEEKIALMERQFEELEALAQKKEELSQQLENSAKQRVEILEISNYDNNAKQSLQIFLKQCDSEQATKIEQLNKQLAEKLATCREQNSVNGQVIATNLNTRQEIISILTGQVNNDAINTYTATGSVSSSNESSRHQEA
ncbi:FlgN protein [Legionella massiliensis]|uniref:FlgN protein n=1 Tax=Legionella massiliensis TaxID=1034943 RepID=A0A078KXB5_9GAMM|nr:flagellar protein FlgN [Legionella massiliensis]CDZ79045.1 FlgN protein [Legionella massiliensis]CEE14783.1 FlgN protein [Legionella massiliensis]